MTRDERWGVLLELIARDGRLRVEDAARATGASFATIRRDLDQLAQQQMVRRTRGGAVATSISYDLPLRYKTARHAPEKQRIAAVAASLVAPGAVVGVNGGTTTTEAARALATRPDLQADDAAAALTVVTNALNIAAELIVRPQMKVVVTGGVALTHSYELIGPMVQGVLGEVALDIVLLGAGAVDPVDGASTHHEGEAAANHLLASRAARVVVLADSSKLGRRVFARICAIDAIDTLVTDTGVPDEQARRFADAGVEVLSA